MIMMAYIRRMIIDNKPKINFKHIKREIIQFKVDQHNLGGSFDFSDFQF